MDRPAATGEAQVARHRRTALRLALTVVAMFGFGYAMVPLYGLVCEWTGIGGRTGVVQADDLGGREQTDRTVTVEFTANVAAGLPWEFRPVTNRLQVHPGRLYEARFYVRNTTGFEFTGQAVPSVSPALASKYLNKSVCFCFERQTVPAGEGREMLVRFVVEPGLPSQYSTLTLAYTFFNAEPGG